MLEPLAKHTASRIPGVDLVATVFYPTLPPPMYGFERLIPEIRKWHLSLRDKWAAHATHFVEEVEWREREGRGGGRDF